MAYNVGLIFTFYLQNRELVKIVFTSPVYPYVGYVLYLLVIVFSINVF